MGGPRVRIRHEFSDLSHNSLCDWRGLASAPVRATKGQRGGRSWPQSEYNVGTRYGWVQNTMWGLPRAEPNTQLRVPNTQLPVPNTQHFVPNTQNFEAKHPKSCSIFSIFSNLSEQSPNTLGHAPSSLEPSGAPRSPHFALSGAKCGVCIG